MSYFREKIREYKQTLYSINNIKSTDGMAREAATKYSLPPDKPLMEKASSKHIVGRSNDKYEKEADTLTPKILNNTVSSQDSFSDISSTGTIQRKEQAKNQIGPEGGMVTPDFENKLEKAKNGGEPIDKGLQTKVGGALKKDFSQAKVHDDSQSHALNDTIQAQSFTTDGHIFMGKGAGSSSTKAGQELMTHEMVHLGQQGGNNSSVVGGGSSGIIQRRLRYTSTRLIQEGGNHESQEFSNILDLLEEYESTEDDEILDDIVEEVNNWVSNHEIDETTAPDILQQNEALRLLSYDIMVEKTGIMPPVPQAALPGFGMGLPLPPRMPSTDSESSDIEDMDMDSPSPFPVPPPTFSSLTTTTSEDEVKTPSPFPTVPQIGKKRSSSIESIGMPSPFPKPPMFSDYKPPLLSDYKPPMMSSFSSTTTKEEESPKWPSVPSFSSTGGYKPKFGGYKPKYGYKAPSPQKKETYEEKLEKVSDSKLKKLFLRSTRVKIDDYPNVRKGNDGTPYVIKHCLAKGEIPNLVKFSKHKNFPTVYESNDDFVKMEFIGNYPDSARPLEKQEIHPTTDSGIIGQLADIVVAFSQENIEFIDLFNILHYDGKVRVIDFDFLMFGEGKEDSLAKNKECFADGLVHKDFREKFKLLVDEKWS